MRPNEKQAKKKKREAKNKKSSNKKDNCHEDLLRFTLTARDPISEFIQSAHAQAVRKLFGVLFGAHPFCVGEAFVHRRCVGAAPSTQTTYRFLFSPLNCPVTGHCQEHQVM